MIRNKLVMKESENSAPFSMSAFLKQSNVGFLSAISMMNSAEIMRITFSRDEILETCHRLTSVTGLWIHK